MSDLLLDLITYITAQGIITGDGIDGFRDKAPTSPDDCAYLFEYRGDPSHVDNLGRRFVQFTYRAKKYSIAKSKCTEMFKLFGLADESNLTQLTPERWAVIRCISSPTKIGVDEQGRTIFSFNTNVLTYYE